MARSLRVEYPGAYYHVMNRGNKRETVFADQSDIDLFLSKLSEFSENYNVKVICYCLMSNHYHLYLQTPDGNLSKFMQALMTSFTISKHLKDKSCGHLFQGRFKAFLVEDSMYGAEVTRYIHLNPVRISSLASLNIGEKRKLLRKSEISSYPVVIGLRKMPNWLSGELILKHWGNNLKEQRKKYIEYVERGLLRDIDDPIKNAIAQTILGSESFIDRIRKSLTNITENLNIRRELGTHIKLQRSLSFDKLIDIVSVHCEAEKKNLLEKNSRDNEPRQILMYLACKYCRGRYSLTGLSEMLGPVTVGTLSRTRYNMEQKLRNNKKLNQRVKEVESYIVKS